MNILKLCKPLVEFAKRHSNVILTTAASVGVVATAVAAVKCSKKHAMAIEDAEYEWSHEENEEPLPAKKKVAVTVKCYWPAVMIGAATITCFIANGVISAKKVANLGAAYNVAVTSLNECKKVYTKAKPVIDQKLKEESGDTSDTDDTKKDLSSWKKPDHTDTEIKITKTGKGDVLFKEPFTGQFFYSDPEFVRSVINEVNEVISQGGECSLNEFFDRLFIEPSLVGDDFVWEVIVTGNMQIGFGSGIYMGNEPYILLDYKTLPYYAAPAYR